MENKISNSGSYSDPSEAPLSKQNSSSKISQPSLAIIGQDFICGKTIFIIRNHQELFEHRKFAYELYQDRKSLEQFDFNDLLLILSTAVQEQTIEDMKEFE